MGTGYWLSVETLWPECATYNSTVSTPIYRSMPAPSGGEGMTYVRAAEPKSDRAQRGVSQYHSTYHSTDGLDGIMA